MIKVLHLVGKMDRGGLETFLMNVYRKLNREEFQFDFLCCSNTKGEYDDEINLLGGKIIHLPKSNKGNKFTKYLIKHAVWTNFLKPYVGDYDIVHIHGQHALSSFLSIKMLKKAGFKNIILHSHNAEAPRIRLHKIFRPFLKKEKIIRYACSEDAGKWMYGRQEVKKGKISVIHNGIDLESFKFDDCIRAKKRKELFLSEEIALCHIGRLHYQKNHKFLLKVFDKLIKKNPNYKLFLIGTGELEDEIRENIRLLHIQDNVSMLGVRTDINELLNAFDVFVFPSLFEGLGIVGIEAQANSLPVIASSTITRELQVSQLIRFLPIDDKDSVAQWVKAIIDVQTGERNNDVTDAAKSGYDINDVVRDLECRYFNMVNG